MIFITGGELRKLSRADLIEIIYQYQKREQELLRENAALHQQLENRRIQIKKAGSIAEAALALNGVFEAAQAAADQYLENITQMKQQNLCDEIDLYHKEATIDKKKVDVMADWWKQR